MTSFYRGHNAYGWCPVVDVLLTKSVDYEEDDNLKVLADKFKLSGNLTY